MVEVLRKEFAEYNLTYSIGGQISFDVFPQVGAAAAAAAHAVHTRRLGLLTSLLVHVKLLQPSSREACGTAHASAALTLEHWFAVVVAMPWCCAPSCQTVLQAECNLTHQAAR
jgi:hypothetical protein